MRCTPQCFWTKRVGSWLFGLLLVVGTAHAEPPAPNPDQLVQQLGHPSFRMREEAGKSLQAMGLAARAALTSGCQHSDPEIRQRSNRILMQILERDLQKRVQAFLNDPQHQSPQGLPGIEIYQAAVGNAPKAVTLYAEMIRNHAALLDSVERSPEQVGKRYAAACQELFIRMKPSRLFDAPTVCEQAEVAALLVMGCHAQAADADVPYAQLSNLLRVPALAHALNPNSGDDGEPMRRLFTAWANKQTNPQLAPRLFLLAIDSQLTAMLPLARKQLDDPKACPRGKGQAILVLGKFGGPDDRPRLIRLLDDATVVHEVIVNDTRSSIELRDIALAMLIASDGDAIEQYPFDRVGRKALSYRDYYNYGFTGDAARQKAQTLWRNQHLPMK
ncbi:hypothetical protein [Tuwongella immobilis]|uniref:HEAT repeat domain-containing protein n=1 Tax=Tuwongella immobilis TaxID=692036 RepID=A0A6C2YL22_9BACT|nr:hypothetical protein [Tuwongella immobilis]VIP01813.1 Uncharacterized protein OS=Blastopirellula marina DSM 3645 GN=DSM3645_27056 PE=4 SV=1 [Tuwongella immobilis]VTR99528.1 Uncharacterized protein OS=Blastopirellula marina DSM 3645 GN=DSM3645_27056 PE=4 SV=1 [Tuwongella immobilis]